MLTPPAAQQVSREKVVNLYYITRSDRQWCVTIGAGGLELCLCAELVPAALAPEKWGDPASDTELGLA